MNYTVLAIYKKPEDAASFEKHYKEVHLPLAKKIPGLKQILCHWISGGARGKSDIHMVAELVFNNEEDFKRAMGSEENKACGKDLANFAGAGVEVVFASSRVEEGL